MLVDQFAEANDLVIQLRRRRVHVRMRIADGLWFVMGPQGFVVAQANRNRFVSAVHRNQIDVDVDQQIAFGTTAVYTKRLVVFRMAERDQTFVIFGIVVVIAVGIIFVEDRVADHPAHFPLGHLAV